MPKKKIITLIVATAMWVAAMIGFAFDASLIYTPATIILVAMAIMVCIDPWSIQESEEDDE